MRMRAFAVAALSLLLASCVDSERLRSNLGGPAPDTAEAGTVARAATPKPEPSPTGRDAPR
ncbi:MAG: hypothetical protein AB7G08_29690 [Hyphomicrobiaceae bacterium]